jgi:hypothetical protein
VKKSWRKLLACEANYVFRQAGSLPHLALRVPDTRNGFQDARQLLYSLHGATLFRSDQTKGGGSCQGNFRLAIR